MKYVVIILSFVFVFFTLKILTSIPWLLFIPLIIVIIDFALIRIRGRGINKMIFEVWGILIACCWIVNLMLIMMDIMNFFSNIFGVSVILFTCVFIAVGNNLAGWIFSFLILKIYLIMDQLSNLDFKKWVFLVVMLHLSSIY